MGNRAYAERKSPLLRVGKQSDEKNRLITRGWGAGQRSLPIKNHFKAGIVKLANSQNQLQVDWFFDLYKTNKNK